PPETDPCTPTTHVLDDCLCAAVTGGERLDVGDQAARGGRRLHRQCRIGTICHVEQRRQTAPAVSGTPRENVMLITDIRAARGQCDKRFYPNLYPRNTRANRDIILQLSNQQRSPQESRRVRGEIPPTG